jgi:hypothetical protein
VENWCLRGAATSQLHDDSEGPAGGNGRRPKELHTMLRIYFLQQWFNLADPAVEEAWYDSATLSHGISDLQKAAEEGFSNLVFERLPKTASRPGRLIRKFGTLFDPPV